MRLPLNKKKRGEEAINKPGDYSLWSVLHMELACPQCGSVQDFLKPGLKIPKFEPLTVEGTLKCAKCEVEFEIRNDEALIAEEPLPPLDETKCFLCNGELFTAGHGPVYTGNVPALCYADGWDVIAGKNDARAKILKKSADYGLELRID